MAVVWADLLIHCGGNSQQARQWLLRPNALLAGGVPLESVRMGRPRDVEVALQLASQKPAF